MDSFLCDSLLMRGVLKEVDKGDGSLETELSTSAGDLFLTEAFM